MLKLTCLVCLLNNWVQISMHFYEEDIIHENISTVHEVQMEMLEILGISRERVVLVDQQVRKTNTCRR